MRVNALVPVAGFRAAGVQATHGRGVTELKAQSDHREDFKSRYRDSRVSRFLARSARRKWLFTGPAGRTGCDQRRCGGIFW